MIYCTWEISYKVEVIAAQTLRFYIENNKYYIFDILNSKRFG